RLVGRGCAHVGELLLFHDIHVKIHRSRVFADDHALVNLGSRCNENLSTLLKVVNRVCRCLACPIRNEGTRWPRWNIALPLEVTVEQRVHDCRTPRIREYFASKTDQASGGNMEFQPDAS